jgi:hypothetical protein
MRTLLALLLACISAYYLFLGVLGPLTPSSGALPSWADAGFYGALPLLGLFASVSISPAGPLRFVLVVLLIGAIAVLGYLALTAAAA